MELQSTNGDIGTNSGVQTVEHDNKIPTEALCVLEEDDDMVVKVDHEAKTQLIYGVLDTPPLSVSIICGFQVLIDFSLTVKAATLVFIPGRGSAISSGKQVK